MNFQTPPVMASGPTGNNMRGGYGNMQGGPQDSQLAYPQIMPMSQQSPTGMHFQQSPYQQPHRPLPPPHQQTFHGQQPTFKVTQPSPGGGSAGKNKQKKPSGSRQSLPSPTSASQPLEQSNDNGLTLNPEDFSREVRFQMPSFLSNQVGGQPTFPPGGEAWSGFNAGQFYDNGNGQSLTPGTLFGNIFGQQPNEGQQSGAGQDGSSQRNVLDGLSGFMTEQGGWDQWPQGDKDRADMSGQYNYANHTAMIPPSGMSQSSSEQRAPPPAAINTNASSRKSSVHHSDASPMTSTHGTRRPTMSSETDSTGTMPTSALLPQHNPFGSSAFPYVANLSESVSQNQTGTINIASSSTAPYAPPSNTHQLLQGPSLPNLGSSLTDGPGLYSTTGFDMVGVLSRVASRKDPKTVLGPVDLSCSFLVVDIRRFDSPIVYASPTFSALTGYELPQILGRNCRFLQSPEGDVVKGSKRKYTDNVAVAHLKRMLNAGKECQASLINYRRGGIPFINLVTVVPIPWEGTDIVYHVGFQVDLVEQPNAILRNMRDGSYQVNYTVTNPPQPTLRLPGPQSDVSGLNDDVLDVMGSRVNHVGFGIGEDSAKMEWYKMVLENADDFVHVLSLKGMFQYVSPSVRRVLEYEPEDLLNKNISDICHPSDIVPLMRELKDSTHSPAGGEQARHVNLVFRIRRRNSGYVWIECTGRLHVEPGKGRKAVILSGRAKSVPTLPWDSVAKNGGLGQTEFWAKLSHQGLVLHATSSVSSVLGYSTAEVLGQSIYSVLPGGSNGPPPAILTETDPTSAVSSVNLAIRAAIAGNTRNGASTARHKLLRNNGQVIDCVSVFYAHRSTDSTGGRQSDDESVDSGLSRPSIASSSSPTGAKPVYLVVQVKAIVPTAEHAAPATNVADATLARPVVHPPSSNVFEELETTRGTSWQYELHQLRLVNRRLKEDITAVRAKVAGMPKTKGKKRKVADPYSEGSMAPPPPPVPDQFAAAPRHQLAPGFGLVPPGMTSPYY